MLNLDINNYFVLNRDLQGQDKEVFVEAILYDTCSDSQAEHVQDSKVKLQ